MERLKGLLRLLEIQKDPYAVLGIAKGADKSIALSAYRKLAMKYHPDRGGDKEKFQDIEAAWRAIKSGEIPVFQTNPTATPAQPNKSSKEQRVDKLVQRIWAFLQKDKRKEYYSLGEVRSWAVHLRKNITDKEMDALTLEDFILWAA